MSLDYHWSNYVDALKRLPKALLLAMWSYLYVSTGLCNLFKGLGLAQESLLARSTVACCVRDLFDHRNPYKWVTYTILGAIVGSLVTAALT